LLVVQFKFSVAIIVMPLNLNSQDRILKKYQLVKPKEIRIPTRQDWQKPDKIIDHNVDLWFADGSGIDDCFGAGVYGPYITIGKAYLWAAFPRCSLPK
jgi:hypothetical protein